MSAPEPHVGGAGKLAKVIATRGGKAAPEAPFVIEHREALIYMLCEAAELEHAIMCEYLFAVFSLKQSIDEGLTSAQLEVVTRWRKAIAHVARQEMLHLALVQNVLSAIGAAPHLSRPNLPQPANHYPAGVRLALLPFGEPALRHFMFLERPEGMALDDTEGLAAVGGAVAHMEPGEIVPRLQDFATIGHLYRSIEEGLARLTEKLGEQALFIGPPTAQATSRDFTWPELLAVTDLRTARAAIEEILDQGEGPRGHWRQAHFGQFVNILDEYLAMKDADPGFEPTRPVLVANVRADERASDIPLITDAATARCADLFNVGYEILLLVLERYFAHTEETTEELATLASVTLQLMMRVLTPLGGLLCTLPVGGDHPGRTAGPSFELFYESDYLVPHRDAAWALLNERLRDSAAFCRDIERSAAGPLAERLAPIRAAFDDLADALAVDARPNELADLVAKIAERVRDANQAADVRALLLQAVELIDRGSAVVQDQTLGFEARIKPLFRENDRESMRFAFDLWAYDDVSRHATAILEQVRNGTMPCDGPWPAERVRVFEQWVESGMPA